MKLTSTFTVLALQLSVTHGWTTQRVVVSESKCWGTRLGGAVDGTQEQENPCWQDFYDDDCSMTNAYSASFVASKWIKGMPCAAGVEVGFDIRLLNRVVAPRLNWVTHLSRQILFLNFCCWKQDCDYPEDLNMPGPRHNAGDQVDVMAFLNLKRAEGVNKKFNKDISP